jgi:hypothetical protein
MVQVMHGHGLACARACRSRVCTRALVSRVNARGSHVSNFVHLSIKMTSRRLPVVTVRGQNCGLSVHALAFLVIVRGQSSVSSVHALVSSVHAHGSSLHALGSKQALFRIPISNTYHICVYLVLSSLLPSPWLISTAALRMMCCSWL